MIPIAILDASGPAFASTQQAAIYASAAAYQRGGNDSEFCGVVYERAGAIYYSAPVSEGQPDQCNFAMRKLASDTVLALYHNHIDVPGNDHFSGSDLDLSYRLKLPTFVFIAHTKMVLGFDPATRARTQFADPL